MEKHGRRARGPLRTQVRGRAAQRPGRGQSGHVPGTDQWAEVGERSGRISQPLGEVTGSPDKSHCDGVTGRTLSGTACFPRTFCFLRALLKDNCYTMSHTYFKCAV